MTFPKIKKYWGFNKKIQISFISEFFAILFELGKLHVFQNCILGPRKCSSFPKYFI